VRLGGHQDEPVLEAEAPDQLRADALQPEPDASDALDGARRVAKDAAVLHLEPADADAEKLAAQAPDARVRDAYRLAHQAEAEQEQRSAAAELCTPGAAQSAAQSCAAQEAAADRQPLAVLADAGELRQELAVLQTLEPEALRARVEQPLRRAVVPGALEARSPARLESQEQL